MAFHFLDKYNLIGRFFPVGAQYHKFKISYIKFPVEVFKIEHC